jgi:putative FmdB family regulatory protein
VPTYQYACTKCDHRFEAVQSFSDSSLTSCPQCAGNLRKLYGAVGVVFKGSGFYRTDSRAKASSDEAKSTAAPDNASKKSEVGKPGAEKAGAAASTVQKQSGSPKTSGSSSAATKTSSAPAAASS